MEQAGIILETSLPLQWRVAESFPQASVQRWTTTNLILLKALAILDAAPLPREHPPDMVQERLEAKLDLLIALFSQLILRDPAPPAEVAMKLSAHGVSWLEEAGPEPGAKLALALYLSPKLPLPLTLPAAVTALHPQGHGIEVQATFLDLEAELREALEQAVFRAHRRAIHARQNPASGA
jgi:Atypical PilZ domain, cyclic di-GMP receptor